jgi:N utilization substance protein B
MGRRRKARESTLQILFQLEFDSSQPEQIIREYWTDKKAGTEEKELSDKLVHGIVEHQTTLDSVIQSLSEHWRISRMLLVDRNILRMAAFELLFDESLAPAIVINEAIEIAKKYSSSQSAAFINGILDTLSKNLSEIKKSLKEK